MQHSNCYLNVKNIDHGIASLNNGKIGSCLQIGFFFLLYRSFQPPLPFILTPPPPTYLILPNVPTPKLIRTSSHLFDTQEYHFPKTWKIVSIELKKS